jgi:hypothetical protein
MADVVTLKEAVENRGPYLVWELMSEDEQRAAAAALWTHADRDSRTALEVALAKELKFRPQSVRRLSVERVVGRLVRMADSLPDTVLFQFLFHLHMAERRELMVEFLDAVGLPHEDGVLNLPEDAGPPGADTVLPAARNLLEAHGHQGLVYLTTLKVADSDFWAGVDDLLEDFAEDGTAVE